VVVFLLYQSTSAKKPQFPARSRYSSSSSSRAECSPMTPCNRSKNVPSAVSDAHVCTPVIWSSRPMAVKRAACNDSHVCMKSDSVGGMSQCIPRTSSDGAGSCREPAEDNLTLDQVCRRHPNDAPRELLSTGLTMEFGGLSAGRTSGHLTPEAKRCRCVPDVETSPHPCSIDIPKLDLDEDEMAADAGCDVTPIAPHVRLISTPHCSNSLSASDRDDQSCTLSSTAEAVGPLQTLPSINHDFGQINKRNQETCPMAREAMSINNQKAKPKVVTLHLSLPNCTLESDESMATTPIKNAKKFMVNIALVAVDVLC
jgi:hypothetical protein